MIGASSVLAWVMIVGFSVGIVPAIVEAPSAPPLDARCSPACRRAFVHCRAAVGYLALSVGRVSIVA
jgi:hypothetical protein